MGDRAERRIAANWYLRSRTKDRKGLSRLPGEPVMRKAFRSGFRGRTGDWVKSSVVGLLLFSVVASSVAGAGTLLFCIVILAWALFPLLVGTRDALEAGCIFMLVSLGVVIVVGLAHHGLGALTP